MFFESNAEAARLLDSRLTRVEQILRQLKPFVDQEKLLNGIFGPMEGLQETIETCLGMHHVLIAAQTDLRFRNVTPRAAIRSAKQFDAAISMFEKLVRQMTASAQAGRDAFHRSGGLTE